MVRRTGIGFRSKVVLALMALGAGVFVTVAGSSSADVTTVIGSAYGYSAPNTVLFGGAQPPIGPVPVVTLPAGGSATPITASADTGRVAYGPGVLFTSNFIEVSTEGTTGAGGSVTSTAHIEDVPTSTVGEILYAGTIDSTCTADESGAAGATALLGPGDAGHTAPTLRISDGDPDVDGDETYVDLPANPLPNTAIDGQLESVGDHFTVVFNEQIMNADGSITVNAVHEYLLGPTLTGNLIIGQVVCGVTATVPTTSTSSTVPGSTSSTSSTSSTVPTSTSTTSSTVPRTTSSTSSTTSTVPRTTSSTTSTTTTVVAPAGGGGNGTGTATGNTGTTGGTALARTGGGFARMGWLAGLVLILGIWLVRAARFERYAAPWDHRRWW